MRAPSTSGTTRKGGAGDTAARGEYQAQAEKYVGESRARNLTDRAGLARWEGNNAFIGSILEGIGGVAMAGARYDLNYGAGRTSGARLPPFRTTVSYG
jgi:hypothetical protein